MHIFLSFAKTLSNHETDHDDVIKRKHFPRYWPFVRGIHRSPVNSPHKGQWRGALMLSLICAWIKYRGIYWCTYDYNCLVDAEPVTINFPWVHFIQLLVTYFITSYIITFADANLKVTHQPNTYKICHSVNTLRPTQNGRHFADDTFKRIFVNENVRILIEISLKFVPKGTNKKFPALVQIMAWRRPGDKPLSEPMLVCLPTRICITRPQWVKAIVYTQVQTKATTIHGGQNWPRVKFKRRFLPHHKSQRRNIWFGVQTGLLLSGVPDLFDRNKILSGGDLSHYQVPHCIRVFFYFVWFVFIHHNFQSYFELCTYVTFWIFTHHKIWILLIIFCFIWDYWIIYSLTCLEVFWSVVS